MGYYRLYILFLVFVVSVFAACAMDEDTIPDPLETGVSEDPGVVTPNPFGQLPDTADGLEPTTAVDCSQGLPPIAVEAGSRQTVRANVVGTRAEDVGGEPATVLELGLEGGDSPLVFVPIPEWSHDAFPQPPAELYDGREICVTDVVEDIDGRLTMVVTLPSDITVVR